jgi:hypothetical protein
VAYRMPENAFQGSQAALVPLGDVASTSARVETWNARNTGVLPAPRFSPGG